MKFAHLKRQRERVTHVKLASDVGRWNDNHKLLLVQVCIWLEEAAVLPPRIPAGGHWYVKKAADM